MKIEVAIGEIIDKLSILELKKENITDRSKLENINKEYNYLYQIVFNELKVEFSDYALLVNINKSLWEIEDAIRVKDYKKEFDEVFISLAKRVYVTNDKRAAIKKDLNIKYNSEFIEEKSYSQYEGIN